jgi:predicted TPR repeat methyltransferase
MNKATALYNKALKSHREGDFLKAQTLYQKILKKNPQHAASMHQLGLLAVQLNQLDTAIAWLKQALAISPDDPIIHNNLGNAYKISGQWLDAIDHFQQALKLNPDYAEAHNNLGGVYYKQKNFPLALSQYEMALSLHPDYIEAQYNIALLKIREGENDTAIFWLKKIVGHHPHFISARNYLANLLLKKNDLDAAIPHYEAILALDENDIETLNNLGALFLKQQKYENATSYFNKVLLLKPKHKEARSNLAATYLQQDKFSEAIWHYQLFLQLVPQDPEANYNLGVALMGAGYLQEAAQSFEKSLITSPNNVDTLCNLAAIALKTDNLSEAIQFYAKAKKFRPEDEVINYMLDALTGKKGAEKAPKDYIKSLFDNYASYFDKHVKEALAYETPKILFDFLQPFLPSHQKLSIVDLGCGTGLSSELFRNHAEHLIGIDISPRMLAKAKEKNIYDELIEGDIVTALSKVQEPLDLILAIDTFVYFGNLEEVFQACYQVLKKNGLFSFSVEEGFGDDYHLETTGRYTHAQNYIKNLIQKNNFELVDSQSVDIRMQAEKPVRGVVFLTRKP